MATSKLDKATWAPYLEQISKMLEGKQTHIEVAGLNIGDQLEAEWIPLLGISYDHKNDLVQILVEGLDHLIRNPKEIYVDYGPPGLSSMEVVDRDDVREIIRFRDPLMLPAPG
ncbi:MAG: DUF5335 domain-containing protein [Massilia sp.]